MARTNTYTHRRNSRQNTRHHPARDQLTDGAGGRHADPATRLLTAVPWGPDVAHGGGGLKEGTAHSEPPAQALQAPLSPISAARALVSQQDQASVPGDTTLTQRDALCPRVPKCPSSERPGLRTEPKAHCSSAQNKRPPDSPAPNASAYHRTPVPCLLDGRWAVTVSAASRSPSG